MFKKNIPVFRQKHLPSAYGLLDEAGIFSDNNDELLIKRHLSGYLAYVDLRMPHYIDYIKMMVTVIKTFAPLIDEKIIELRTPVIKYCTDCMGRIEAEIDKFLEVNIDIDADTTIYCLNTLRNYNVISVNNPDVYRLCGISLEFQIPKGKKSCLPKLSVHDKLTIKVRDNPYMLDEIKTCLKNDLINVISSVASAHETHSLFISKSELDTLFLSSVDRSNPQKSEMEAWEAMRSINLPWVGELDIPQILKLRHEASESLESLRENLSLAFMQGGEKKATEVVSELTSKVSELKQEIMTNDIVKRSNKRYSAAFGSLAITLVIYGLASNVPVTTVGSVAALLVALSHMRTSEKEQEEKNAKIVTSPAYALLKAKDLLSCRE